MSFHWASVGVDAFSLLPGMRSDQGVPTGVEDCDGAAGLLAMEDDTEDEREGPPALRTSSNESS